MQIGSPFDALHNAMSRAVMTDLPDNRFWRRDWVAFRKLPAEERAKLCSTEGPGEWCQQRPSNSEVRITIFDQIWGSTALGYGGIGGAAMTPAYTIIVTNGEVSCVYFGEGPLAYTVDHRTQSAKGAEKWNGDLAARNLAEVKQAARYD